MSKYYSVAIGRNPGIYLTWNEAKKEVIGFPKAIYKSFKTLNEAEDFLQNNKFKLINTNDKFIIYTDGSYDHKTNTCGYGVIIFTTEDVKHTIYGRILEPKITNNVAELYAIYIGLLTVPKEDVVIHTDSMYAIGALTTFKTSINEELINSIKDLMKNRSVEFVHVRGHMGNKYNEEVDQLANQGRLTKEKIVFN